MCARCSPSQVSAFQHYRNLLLTSSLNLSSLPPTTLCHQLPPPPSSRAWASRTPLVALSGQPHIPLLLLFRCRRWFRHSLCLPPCPFRPSSRPVWARYSRPLPDVTFPLPSSNPHTPLYLTQTTPPTLAHWWFSTWGAQPPHPTDGSPPLTHQPITLHLPAPYPALTVSTIPAYRPPSPWWSIDVFVFVAIPLPSGLPFHPGLFSPTPSLCVSLPSFQLSALSPRLPCSPFYSSPSSALPITLCPDGCCSNALLPSYQSVPASPSIYPLPGQASIPSFLHSNQHFSKPLPHGHPLRFLSLSGYQPHYLPCPSCSAPLFSLPCRPPYSLSIIKYHASPWRRIYASWQLLYCDVIWVLDRGETFHGGCGGMVCEKWTIIT